MRRRYFTTFALTAALAGGLASVIPLPADGGPLPSYEAEIAPDAPPRFVIYGDSRQTLRMEFWRPRYDAERLLLIQALAAESPAFIVNTGDLVSEGSHAGVWRQFYDESQPLFSRRIPYFPGLGNHEYWGDTDDGLRHYFSLFPQLKGRKWYEVRFRSALVVILDSNFDELTGAEVEAQNAWLGRTLAEAEKDPVVRHVIVCCHHAPYTNSTVHGDSRTVQRHFVGRRTPKVKAFITGHVHSYERFVKEGVQFVVSGGGGAPTTAVETDEPRHPDEFKGPAYRRFHYLRFTIDGGRLACDVLMLQDDRSWKRVDGFECP